SETDIEAQLKKRGGLLGRASEGVHDADERAAVSRVAKHGQNLGGRFAEMNDQWQARRLRQADMPIEIILLQRQRGIFPIQVEARFAQGDDLGLAAELDNFVPVGGLRFGGVIGMDTSR